VGSLLSSASRWSVMSHASRKAILGGTPGSTRGQQSQTAESVGPQTP
jgi:hypothetical protein